MVSLVEAAVALLAALVALVAALFDVVADVALFDAAVDGDFPCCAVVELYDTVIAVVIHGTSHKSITIVVYSWI